MIVCVENPKQSTTKPLELIHKYSMEQATTIRTFKKKSFKTASQKSRYLGIYLIKAVRDLYTENDKFPNVVPKFLKFQKF